MVVAGKPVISVTPEEVLTALDGLSNVTLFIHKILRSHKQLSVAISDAEPYSTIYSVLTSKNILRKVNNQYIITDYGQRVLDDISMRIITILRTDKYLYEPPYKTGKPIVVTPSEFSERAREKRRRAKEEAEQKIRHIYQFIQENLMTNPQVKEIIKFMLQYYKAFPSKVKGTYSQTNGTIEKGIETEPPEHYRRFMSNIQILIDDLNASTGLSLNTYHFTSFLEKFNYVKFKPLTSIAVRRRGNEIIWSGKVIGTYYKITPEGEKLLEEISQ